MTRIIAGASKGRRLAAPRGQLTRPTGSRVKQTLFDILAPRLAGARFLDLFAGSGAIGLEALSRGAGAVVLVERDARVAAVMRANAEQLRGLGTVRVRQEDVRRALSDLAREGRVFDIVFLDPPYDSALYEPTLEAVARLGLLAGEGLAAAEHFHKRPLPERIGGLVRERLVRVGDHVLSFYRLAEQAG